MDLAAKTVAVTGATGFIGRYLVRALEARGARVIAVVRDPAKMNGSAVETRRADLGDVDALTAAFAGCDAVVSNAGVVSVGRRSRKALMDANARGTQNVFTAMTRAGVTRAVMTSSANVYQRKRGNYYVESDPLWAPTARLSRPFYYGLSKAIAEREAWRLAGESDIALSVARPSGVFGADDNTGFTLWLRRFMSVPGLTFFPTHFYVPNVYAGDLAEAMLRMLERKCAIGKAYNVCGDPNTSYWSMLEAYRAAGGSVPQIVVPVPFPVRYGYSLTRAVQDLDFENRPPQAAFTDMLQLR